MSDAAWLRDRLQQLLGWDGLMIEGLVESINAASNQSDVDELVQNFIGDNAAAVRCVKDFLAAKNKQKQQKQHVAQAQQRAAAAAGPAGSYAGATGHAHKSSSMSGASLQQSGQSSSSGDGMRMYRKGDGADVLQHQYSVGQAGKQQSKGAPGLSAGAKSFSPAAAASTPAPAGPAVAQQQPEYQDAGPSASGTPSKVLGMFKQGGRLKPATAGRGPRRDDQGLTTASSLERKVVNCLGCGKIYDLRNTTNDNIKFLERGGLCTFCGAQVALTYRDQALQKQQQEAAAAAAGGAVAEAPAGEGAGAAGGNGEGDAATAAAIAFKNRLVDYDRNSAKRTTVIDDQSDFFEVETNAWLTDKEREELRRRRRLEEEAEAARRKRVTVTLDLIGRKVVVDESAGAGGTSFQTGKDLLLQQQQQAAAAAAAAEAAAAAAEEQNTPGMLDRRGNDLGARAPASAQDIARAAAALRKLKIQANPNATANANGPGPTFVAGAHAPHQQQQQAGGLPQRDQSRRKARQQQQAAAGRGSRFGPGGAGAAGGAGGPSRLQHNLTDEFDAFNVEVMYEDVEAALIAAEAGKPFDLCPHEHAAAPLLRPTKAPRAEGDISPGALPPGMVLLKGWLTLQQQADIVEELRQLGAGPGGFYTPSYGGQGGGQMHLRMMCLGKHWEPRTHSYEDIRSSHDGARPPAITHLLSQLCKDSLAVAAHMSKEHQGLAMPPLQPDVCLVNFYEKTGRLGMHQDKDESSDSLRRAHPVVSFSIGDSADFIYGRSYDESRASCIRLESGDVLVFGGPSRMVYHAVPKIYPNTAPAELLKLTGLRPGRLNLTFRQAY